MEEGWGRTAGEVVAAGLAAHGVELVFGIPGTHNLGIYAALPAAGIGHVVPRHEQGAGYAADAYARVTGRPGVVLTTTGPGIMNAATAAAQAYSDSIPLLLLSPGMPRTSPPSGRGHLHEAKDQRAAMDALVGQSIRVDNHAALAAAIADAFAGFAAARPRPVHIEIPLDMVDEIADVEILGPLPGPRPVANPGAVARAAAMLTAARRPLVIAGGGTAESAGPLRRLAERHAIPVLTTFNGKGTLPEDHEQSLGAGVHSPAAADIFGEADVVLAVGTELGGADFWNGWPELGGRLIRLDIDPAQAHLNYTAAEALIGDAGPTLARLDEAMTGDGPPDGRPTRRWRSALAAYRAAEGARWLHALDAIHGVLARDAIVTGDSAMACYYGAAGNLPRYLPRGFLYPTGFGTLGYALPAAIGAKLAAPERQVVALTGDGGLMFTIAELATAVQQELCLPVVVFDNSGYGEIRAEMRARSMEPYAVDLAAPDFVALAAAMGAAGASAPTPEHLATELALALERPGPTLIVTPEASIPEGVNREGA
ncbi:5-guanidino-2-oxopentanoate decarboxylase [Sphaerisporangium flaviroseum]|uniref:5-guanidino-2-oxopentanoate decarboxylase n=1 Tax=Sphaerisporangium flaviroseum TaxID=509199 RepID=A0ABP7I6N4_9ACTN